MNLKAIIFQILLSGIIILSLSCKPESVAPMIEMDVSSDWILPKKYIVTKSNEVLNIDGMDDEASWQSALYTDLFIDIKGVEKPRFDTRCKMLWDDQYLYIYAKLHDPHIWGDIEGRDEIIYFNNDFEVFLDPGGRGEPYGEIEINALGTEWDLLLSKAYRAGGKPIFNWDIEGLKTAVHVEGSLNDPSDIDNYWAVEMAIPLMSQYEFITRRKTKITEGEQWRVNFSRVQWQHEIQDGKYQRKMEDGHILSEENWVWSPQLIVNMHEPEKWGYLQFTLQKSTDQLAFSHDKDEELKQVLFAVFRKLRFDKNYYAKESSIKKNTIINAISKEDKRYDIHYFKTKYGFEMMATNPGSNTTYVLDQEGHLKQLK